MKNISIQVVASKLGLSSSKDFQVTDYQIDSRLCGPGTLFFALPGERVDGHDFLKEVAHRGGVAAVVEEQYTGPDFGLELFRVPKTEAALQELARLDVEGCRATIIGITGSLGKTTTKEFIATLLEKKFRTYKSFANYNTKLTYPLTLLNRTGEEEVLVVEMGMTEPGDIGRLVDIGAPDIAVVTKIAWVHGAFFPGGLADIAKGKAEIFKNPRTKRVVFDHGLYAYEEVFQQFHGEKISFSLENGAADYFLSRLDGQYFVDERGVRGFAFDPPYKQEHILHNFLAAVSVARLMKMSWDEINQQLKFLQLPKMRFEQIERNGVLFINDAYNANPDSMRAAMNALPQPAEGGKRIAVLGMMADMGAESEEIHREVGRFAQKKLDHLLVLGKEATAIYEGFLEAQKPAEQFFDYKSLADRLNELIRPGDVVLVKASRCVHMENLFAQGMNASFFA